MIGQYFAGLGDYFTAIGLVRRLKLWKHFFVPGLISVGLWAIVLTLALLFSDDIAHWALSWYPWETGRSIVEGFGYVIFLVMILFVFYFIFKDILLAVLGPFLSPVSAKVEQYLTGEMILGDSSLKGQVRSNVRGINLAWWLISRELLRVLPLTILGLIPLLSLPIAVVIFFIQSFYAGLGNMDFTLERHLNAKESKRFGKRFRWLCMGSGTVHMALFLFVPIIGWYLAPVLSTVASTVSAHRKLSAYKLEKGIF